MGLCPHCMYELSGLGPRGMATCPECGREVALPGVSMRDVRWPVMQRRATMLLFTTPLIVAAGMLVLGYAVGLVLAWVWAAAAIYVLVRLQRVTNSSMFRAGVEGVVGGFFWAIMSHVLAVVLIAAGVLVWSVVMQLW